MNIQVKKSNRTLRNLAIFITFILAIGWIGRGIDLLTGEAGAEGPGMLLWLVTPLVISLFLRSFAGDGWKDLGIKPQFKENITWYVAAIVVFPFLTGIVLLIGCSSGLVTFPNFSLNALGMIIHTFALGLLPQFIKNVFEEFAWRGYLAPKVYSLRLNDFIGHIIVGFIWGAWHIPYYLFFLDRAVLQDFTTLNLKVFIPLSIVVMIAWSMVYGEIFLRTHSIWPAVLMHMVEDSFLNQLFTDQHIRIVAGMDWLISPVNGLISIFFFILTGIGLHQLRKSPVSVFEK